MPAVALRCPSGMAEAADVVARRGCCVRGLQGLRAFRVTAMS